MQQPDEKDLNIDLRELAVEPADVYHAQAGRYLSSHQLMDFMNCPWMFRKKQLGLIKSEESEAFLVGRATHCRILEGREAYESQFGPAHFFSAFSDMLLNLGGQAICGPCSS